MKLTPERKRLVYLLGALVVLGGYSLYTNVLSSPSSSEPSRPAPAPAPVRPATPARSASTTAAASGLESGPSVGRQSVYGRSGAEFRPSIGSKRPEDRIDPLTIDPTLRLDLLAKVQAVNMEGGQRNLFAMSTPPPAPLPPEPKVPVKGVQRAFGPQPQPPPPKPPAAPPPPPINLKYYGYSSAASGNKKHAFFLDGDDILVAGEGEMMKKRYRVVKIGVHSATVEDTQYKHEQTLPLQEEAAG